MFQQLELPDPLFVLYAKTLELGRVWTFGTPLALPHVKFNNFIIIFCAFSYAQAMVHSSLKHRIYNENSRFLWSV